MCVRVQQAEEQAVDATPAEPSARKGPTPEQQTALKAAIANAQTLAEVQRLEDALRSGQVCPPPPPSPSPSVHPLSLHRAAELHTCALFASQSRSQGVILLKISLQHKAGDISFASLAHPDTPYAALCRGAWPAEQFTSGIP